MQQVTIYDEQDEIYTFYYYPDIKSDPKIEKWSKDFVVQGERAFYARLMLQHSVVHKEDVNKIFLLEGPEILDMYFNWVGAKTDNSHIFNPVRLPRPGGK
jgi:hypothetical protein